MVADHLGLFFFPDIVFFRVIGRVSFPLFAWAIANGATYTGNINKYLFRLMLLAVFSQIPYRLLFGIYNISDPGLNVLFTLSFGLLAIIVYKKTGNRFFSILATVILSLIAYVAGFDYGAFGVLTVLLFFLFYKNMRMISGSYLVLVVVFYLIPFVLNKYFGLSIEASSLNLLQFYSLISLPIIMMYSGVQGYKLKSLFYLFYPIHLTLIYLLLIYFK